MKKFLKILAVAAIAVAAAIACVFAGCNNGGGGGGETSSDYNFTIVYEGGNKDGQAVNGQTDGNLPGGKLKTQICLPGVGGLCIALYPLDIYPDANGKLSFSQAKINELFSSETDVTVFIFHAIGVTGYKYDCEIEVNGKNDYELKITLE